MEQVQFVPRNWPTPHGNANFKLTVLYIKGSKIF